MEGKIKISGSQTATYERASYKRDVLTLISAAFHAETAMRHFVVLICVAIPVSILFASCQPPVTTADSEAAITEIYHRAIDEYGSYQPEDPDPETWPYNYHPLLYAAWVYEGRQRVDRQLKDCINDGLTAYITLLDDLQSQIAGDAPEFDSARFLGLISDDAVRGEAERFMNGGIMPLHAFARAWMAPIIEEYPDAPGAILTLLGKNFDGKPHLCRLAGENGDDGSAYATRDWLQLALGACGEDGVRAVLDFDNRLEDLQELAPFDDFWDGELTIPYNLRSIQFARAEALDAILENLDPYRTGGEVSGLHSWMYWDLAWSLGITGGVFPYSGEDFERVHAFLQDGLIRGPLAEGEEAWVIAESLGHVPSAGGAPWLLEVIENFDLPCERRKIGYVGLSAKYGSPVVGWESDQTVIEEFRARSVAALELGPFDCGNMPLLELFVSVNSAFRDVTRETPWVELTDSEMVRLHEAFIDLLPGLTTADERAKALGMASFELMQPEFMMAHPELSWFRDELIAIHNDWSETTSFEGAEITEDDFKVLLDWLGLTVDIEGTAWSS